jgi:hypothetical protein
MLAHFFTGIKVSTGIFFKKLPWLLSYLWERQVIARRTEFQSLALLLWPAGEGLSRYRRF